MLQFCPTVYKGDEFGWILQVGGVLSHGWIRGADFFSVLRWCQNL